jgi:hypothetical protein
LVGLDCLAKLREPVFLPRQLGFQGQDVAIPGRRRVPDRLCVAEIAQLIEQRNAKLVDSRDGAGGGLELARDEAKQRGLAGTVPSHDAPALAGRHVERDVAKEIPDPEADTDATEGKHAQN